MNAYHGYLILGHDNVMCVYEYLLTWLLKEGWKEGRQ